MKKKKIHKIRYDLDKEITNPSTTQVVQWLEFMLPKHGARVRFPACVYIF